MDELSFLAQAKLRADGLTGARRALAKRDTALALDYDRALEHDGIRSVLALATASLVNVAFFAAVESSALDARTPNGEVIIAEVELVDELPRVASL